MSNLATKLPFPDLSLCASTDEIRDEMNYILYEKGCFVATDGHIMVRYSFGDFEHDCGLPDRFAIHRKHFRPLTKAGTERYPVQIRFDGKYLIRFHKGEITHIVPIKLDPKYPNYEEVLERSKAEVETTISEIGFLPSTLGRAMRIAGSILGSSNTIRMRLFARNRAVRITCDYSKDFEMIVMPATLEDQL